MIYTEYMKLLYSMIWGLLCCSTAMGGEARPQVAVTRVDFDFPTPDEEPVRFIRYDSDNTPIFSGERPIRIEITILNNGKISARQRIVDVQVEYAVDSKKNNLYPTQTKCDRMNENMAYIYCALPSRGAWIQVKGEATVAEASAEKKTAVFTMDPEDGGLVEVEGHPVAIQLFPLNAHLPYRNVQITASEEFLNLNAQLYLHQKGEKIKLQPAGSVANGEAQMLYYMVETDNLDSFDGITFEYPAKQTTTRIPFNFRVSLRGVQYAKSTTQP